MRVLLCFVLAILPAAAQDLPVSPMFEHLGITGKALLSKPVFGSKPSGVFLRASEPTFAEVKGAFDRDLAATEYGRKLLLGPGPGTVWFQQIPGTKELKTEKTPGQKFEELKAAFDTMLREAGYEVAPATGEIGPVTNY